MSYANRNQMSSNRTAAIVVVALIHVLLGYALVSGLAYSVVKQAAEDLKTFDVEEEPPPPEEEPPPPEDPQEAPPPPVAAPPPLVRTIVQESPVQATPNPPPFIPTPVARPAPPAPPAPPPVKRVEPRSLSGSLQGLLRDSDYPESAIEREEQGTVGVSLSIGTTGRVTGCSVSSSSGSRTLDSATCRILSSRARYQPGQDSSGNPTAGTVTGRITWRLQ